MRAAEVREVVWMERCRRVVVRRSVHVALAGLLGCVVAAGARAQGAPGAIATPATGLQGAATPGARGAQTGQTGQQTQTQDQTTSTNPADAKTRADTDRQERVTSTVHDVPTEFQRLVADSTGTQLPIFGEDLFDAVPSTFAPIEDIPVAPDYVVGPGDELRIQTFGQQNQRGNYTVSRTGDISYPEVGSIHVAGLHFSQLQAFLKGELSRVYRNFDLTVNLGQLRTIQVFVTGFARRPGSYTISSLSTLLNALFESGGPLPQGSLRDIQVLRGNTTLTRFDLYDLLLHGDKSKDVPLASGDVIFIPPVGPQVAVTGSVDNPAIYEVRPGTTVDDVISLAGGRTSVALGAQIRIERIFEHTLRSILDVDVTKSKTEDVANGDIVTVATILDRYKDAVTLRGNVAFPGRYVWRPGMRITDIVPTVDQLITRAYYRNRNALGNVGAQPGGAGREGALDLSGNSATQTAAAATQAGNTSATKGGTSVASSLTSSNNVFSATTDVVLSAPDLYLNYAVIERLNPTTLSTYLVPFKPGALYIDHDPSQNLELQPGDVITFFSTADVKVPTSQQPRFVRLEGEFVAAGVYSVEAGETFRHLLQRVGGFTPDAYLYGSEFTRQSTKRVQQQRLNEYADSLDAQISVQTANGTANAISSQDAAAAIANAVQAREDIARLRQIVPLGRIVLELKPDSRQIDDIPDLPLEDGDRFVVPRVPSTVSVEGQVYSANAFVYKRGLREHDYLRQAGGPDRNADRKRTFILRADGSVFSTQYGNVDHATVFPGDTVVVPPQLDRRGLFRDIVDISTIVGQLGITAAAIALFTRN